jgi:hypothetical protein
LDHDGHEIALSAALTGVGWSTARYKLYIDGKLVDEQAVSVWSSLIGGEIVLRGQLPPVDGQAKPRKIKVVATLRVFRSNDYVFFVNGQEIHQEWATFGGM